MSQIFTPHDYQLEALEHLYEHRRCGLWMPMGGGKTPVTLTALDTLSLCEDVFPALVLAPKRVAQSVWPVEVAKWDHLKHLRTSTILGDVHERRAALRQRADIYTMNYDNLVWLVEELDGKWPFRTVVSDEWTRLKSFRLRQGSKRARALGGVVHSENSRFIGLTGTPNPAGLRDLWGQLWFVDRGKRLGKTFTAFNDRWFKLGWDGYSMQPLPHAQAEIEALLRDVCLTVDGLPVDEPIVNDIWIDLPPKARRLYDDMHHDLLLTIRMHEVEAANAAVKSGKLLQLANGAIYVDEDGNWETVHDAKLEALDSVIEEANGAPVLVAYKFKSDLARLQKRYPSGRLLDARTSTIDQWNAGRIPILFAHPKCLHPSTEVLTEYRGWVRIVDVEREERVFDGVEFVHHSGCSFSGVHPVTEIAGLIVTPAHKLLVGQEWVEAASVRDCEAFRRAARYTYEGDDCYLGAMLPLRRRAPYAAPERDASQPAGTTLLPGVLRRLAPPHDGHPLLVNLERCGQPCDEPAGQELRQLRSGWSWRRRGLAVLRQLLSRYVGRVSRRSNNRSTRQFEGLLQRELQVGLEHGSAVEQVEQSCCTLSRSRPSPRGVLPCSKGEQGRHITAPEPGNVGGGSSRGLCSLDVQERPQVSEVYDLVDCGPRSRFLIRNSDGDVFISHNSAGHGLNLADGGNILAFFGLTWSLEEYLQIIERIGPLRQKQAGLDRPVFVHRIMARRTVDELVKERIETNRSVQDIMLDAMRRAFSR